MTSTLITKREVTDAVPRPAPTPTPGSAPRPILGPAIITVIVALAVAGIIWQQIVHTPWGLPGHRGVFWLSTLIAV
ncbi:MAG: hypothetical protein ACRDSH_04310, partial [Pseudonocardiaceae bacterium]